MNFTDSVRSCFSQFVTFSGRARRSEFWYFTLFCVLGGLGLSIVDAIIFSGFGDDIGPLNGLFSLITFLPSISVSVRRLHDLDRTGWWWWLVLIPIIGWIILIIWYCTAGTQGPNQYGQDPFGGDATLDDVRATHRSSIPSVARKDD